MNQVKLGSTMVGPDTGPYVIAEIGVNHEGSMELAKRLIREAKAGGCQAAKFQTYKAATLASRNSPAYWDLSKEPTESQYALFSKYDQFGPDQWDVRTRSLSAGELRRLVLAVLVNSPARVLMLDEPTNFLDFDALDVVEEALRRYRGTVLTVTHDRFFAEAVGYSRRWHVVAGGVRMS